MTPKEKAQNLLDIFYVANQPCTFEVKAAKQCALLAVDNIYNALFNYLKDTDELQNADREFAYWEQVEKEIQEL